MSQMTLKAGIGGQLWRPPPELKELNPWIFQDTRSVLLMIGLMKSPTIVLKEFQHFNWGETFQFL